MLCFAVRQPKIRSIKDGSKGVSVVKSSATSETSRIVREIDETRTAEHFRDPYRADARFSRRRQDPEVAKAKARLRTAAWRAALDRRKRPTVSQVGVALAVAFAAHPDFFEIYRLEGSILQRALEHLESNGFSIAEAQDVLRQIRRRMLGEGLSGDVTSRGSALDASSWAPPAA
jgi:hypothetical protein